LHVVDSDFRLVILVMTYSQIIAVQLGQQNARLRPEAATNSADKLMLVRIFLEDVNELVPRNVNAFLPGIVSQVVDHARRWNLR